MSVLRKLGAAAAGALLALVMAGATAGPASADTGWGYSAPVSKDSVEQDPVVTEIKRGRSG